MGCDAAPAPTPYPTLRYSAARWGGKIQNRAEQALQPLKTNVSFFGLAATLNFHNMDSTTASCTCRSVHDHRVAAAGTPVVSRSLCTRVHSSCMQRARATNCIAVCHPNPPHQLTRGCCGHCMRSPSVQIVCHTASRPTTHTPIRAQHNVCLRTSWVADTLGWGTNLHLSVVSAPQNIRT